MSLTNNNHNYSVNRIGDTGKGSKQGQSIYEESSTAKFALGEKLELADGRVFRYTYASAAISAGLCVSTDSAQLIALDTDGVFTVASAGATEITVTDATLASKAKDHYSGAYFGNVTNAEQYRIKSSAASNGNVMVFTLFDPIVTAVAATDDYTITGSPYGGVITATEQNGAYDRVVGVNPIGITSGYYFWLQTAGVAFVKADAATIALGDIVSLSDSVAGTVQTQDALQEPVIGQAVNNTTTGFHVAVNLRLGD